MARFQSGHPRNGAGPKSTFLAVERFSSLDGVWRPEMTDDDWSTRFEWQREGISESTASIWWRIPADQDAGIYRLCHFGVAKMFQKTAYSGCSDDFSVTP